MEARSAIGEWKPDEDRFVLTTGSQGVHGMRDVIARKVFKIGPEKLRVITPDVGGGFGPKIFVYREYPLVLEAAKRLGRPVKWTGDRTEHFLADAQGRDNYRRRRDGDGRGRPVPRPAGRPHRQSRRLYLAIRPVHSLYRRHHVDRRLRHPGARRDDPRRLHQHRARSTPIAAPGGRRRRSCWRSWSTTARASSACGRDEIRRRNFIRPEQFPYRTADRPALRRRRVRRPHDAGHGAGRLGGLRRSA